MNMRAQLPYLSDARADALEREVSASIAADVAHLKALAERDDALEDALTPVDWHERPRTEARLACGCEGRIEKDTDDGETEYPARRWTRECDRHEGRAR